MLTVYHEQLEKQRSNMMVMAIIDLEEHERKIIHTIYEHKWMQALGFSCVAHNSFCVSLKSTN